MTTPRGAAAGRGRTAGTPNTIVLVGYRGCGKSTVARHIAVQLGWRHVDTDDEIESRSGRSVAETFAREGEAAFRALERTVVAELRGLERAVISVGGGAVIDVENRTVLKGLGFCAWLTAPVDVILARLAADERSPSLRPALRDLDPVEEVRQVLAERTPLYRELATCEVPTGGRSAAEVGAEVLAAWRAAGEAPAGGGP